MPARETSDEEAFAEVTEGNLFHPSGLARRSGAEPGTKGERSRDAVGRSPFDAQEAGEREPASTTQGDTKGARTLPLLRVRSEFR